MTNPLPLVPKSEVVKPLTIAGSTRFNPMQGNAASDSNAALTNFQEVKSASDLTEARQQDALGNAIAKATADTKTDSGQTNNSTDDSSDTATSDERCKRYRELFGDDLVDAIADLNAYVFKYKPGMENIDPKANPDDTNVGIMAQELQSNPVTESSVFEDPLSGFLKVDTSKLATTEMAILTAMAKRILELEEKVNGKE